MNLEDIRLINFRNYNNLNAKLNKGTNVLIGKNAQGKTNLIEAIYMCATGKSFRTNRDREIINFNKDEAYIGVNMNIGDFNKFVEIKMMRDNPKIIRVNKRELKSNKELYSGLNVVVFTPEDLKIVKDGPRERRDFIDNGISQIKPVYNYNLNRYRKVLFQRNNLLRSNKFKKDLKGLLEVFDMQISKIGTNIIIERDNYIKELAKICKEIHGQITCDKEDLYLEYRSNIPILDNKLEMEHEYLELMKKNHHKDIEYGTTELGPHRDDIYMSINDKEVKVFGSQGQQRTTVLSIVLSEVELIKKERGIYPVLLLDDVFSELDEERRNYLTKFFTRMQTFITVTDGEDLKSMDNINKTIFKIEDGRLKLGS